MDKVIERAFHGPTMRKYYKPRNRYSPSVHPIPDNRGAALPRTLPRGLILSSPSPALVSVAEEEGWSLFARLLFLASGPCSEGSPPSRTRGGAPPAPELARASSGRTALALGQPGRQASSSGVIPEPSGCQGTETSSERPASGGPHALGSSIFFCHHRLIVGSGLGRTR